MTIKEMAQRKASQPPKTVGSAIYMLRDLFENLGYSSVPAKFANDTEQRLRSRKKAVAA